MLPPRFLSGTPFGKLRTGFRPLAGRFVFCVAGAVLGAVGLPRSAPAEAAKALRRGNAVFLGNGQIGIRCTLAGNRPRLDRIEDKRAGKSLSMEDAGFRLWIDGKKTASLEAFALSQPPAIRNSPSGAEVDFLLECPAHNLEVRLRWQLRNGDFFLRRRLAVRLLHPTPAATLYEADLERLTPPAPIAAVPMGQPLFVAGRVFFGLEYPAGRCRVQGREFTLYHYPGKRLSRAWLALKSEVIGVAGNRPVQDAFAEYIRQIRIPPRNFVLYNSWYDLRRGQMNTRVFEQCFQDFRKFLIVPYGVRLDSFVIDDGWQDHNSIWETDRRLFPGDFGELARYLRAHGSCLGLWMPLTPIGPNLNLNWGRKHGFEVTSTGRAYCISGPRFNRAERRVIRKHEKEFGLNYYKHDFNVFTCAARGHGHLPIAEYGFEANVDAYIRMLEFERRLNPGIFINITSNMWLSPWWLLYADTVWRGGGDTGHERIVPYIQLRDDTITYVDGVLWDRFRRDTLQFPPSALMTHGIVYGRFNRLGGGHEPLHRWTEHVMEYLAPGLMMKELYLTPSLLSKAQWDVLGRALRWAATVTPILARSQMTLGNPHHGEVYGFVHALPEKGRLLWFIRNPSMTQQAVQLDLAGRLHAVPRFLEMIYPYRQTLAPAPRLQVTVPPYQTMVLRAASGSIPPSAPLTVRRGRWGVLQQTRDRLTCVLAGAPGQSGEWSILLPRPASTVILDGAPLPAARGKTRFSFHLSFPGVPGKPTAIPIRSAGPTAAPIGVRLSLPPDCRDNLLGLLVRGRNTILPFHDFRRDGAPVKPRIVRGRGWTFLLVAVDSGRHTITWKLPASTKAGTPFSSPTVKVRGMFFSRRRLPSHRLTVHYAKPGPLVPVPPTPFAETAPMSMPVFPLTAVTVGAKARRSVSAAEFAKIRAAKLHLLLFDVNGQSQYRQKWILINGVRLARVPANPAPISRWHEFILDIPHSLLHVLKRTGNRVVLTNAGGDCYKVGDIALAVQLADGSWAESNHDPNAYSSVRNWRYFEGRAFRHERAESTPLSFAGAPAKQK